jgi:hypothetical protein
MGSTGLGFSAVFPSLMQAMQMGTPRSENGVSALQKTQSPVMPPFNREVKMIASASLLRENDAPGFTAKLWERVFLFLADPNDDRLR